MNNTFLWQIVSSEGVTSYVFGTMHVRELQAFGGMDTIKSCILKCQTYYSEIELAGNEMGVIDQFHYLPDGQDILRLTGQRKYQKLRKSIIKSFGLDVDRVKRFYPIIVTNIIQTSIFANVAESILDFYLYQFADNHDKELRYLESQTEQLSLFHKIPLQYQVKSLLQLGRQPQKARKQIKALLQDYALGNTRQLYQKSKYQLGNMRQMLLYQRNKRMADKLKVDLEHISGFVAVGAAHLFGYHGILRLLKKEGYKVKPQPTDLNNGT